MSVRSADMMPKDWALKAPEYILEAHELGVKILPPSVLRSHLGFHIVNDNEIYFGLNGIRSCGKTASQAIIGARGTTPFKDISDFIDRVNTQKVNTKVFESLVYAGAFDTMGYPRDELLNATELLYNYKSDLTEYYERKITAAARTIEIIELESLITKRDELKKLLTKKNARALEPNELEFIEATKELRRKVVLKEKELPIPVEFNRVKKVPVTLQQMMQQQEYIGCFLGRHPARMIYPEAEALANVFEGINATVAGMVTEIRDMKTKKGQPMAILEIGDGTASAKILLFPRDYAKVTRRGKLPQVKDMIKVSGKVSKEAPVIEIFAETIDIHKG